MLSGKHPVMAVTELCAKFSWAAPKFEVVDHEGPDHKKSFLMKVKFVVLLRGQNSLCTSFIIFRNAKS